MKTKQVIILAAILGLLVLGVVIKNTQKPAELATEDYQPLELSFSSEAVASININKPKAQGNVELLKEAGIWRIKNFLNAKADAGKIQNLLTELNQTKGELRGKDKSLFNDFGIGDGEAFELILKDNAAKELLHLRLGTKKADFESIFIRKEGSEQVFITQSNLLGQIGLTGDLTQEAPKADYWASLNLSAGDTLKVTKLQAKRFEAGREIVSMDVIREGAPNPVWKFTRSYEPFTADPEKVRFFLDSFKDWPAQKIEDPKSKDYGFSSPVWTLTVTSETGEVVFTAGKMDPDTRLYPVKVSDASVIYQIPQYYFQSFDQDDSRFFADNPFGVDPFRLLKVTVHAWQKEISINPKETNPDITGTYLQGLRSLGIKRLIWDDGERKKAKSPGREWLELQFDGGKSFILDTGETVPGDSEKLFDYAAIVRGTQIPFVLSQESYEKIFKNLEPLTPPAQAVQSAQSEKK